MKASDATDGSITKPNKSDKQKSFEQLKSAISSCFSFPCLLHLGFSLTGVLHSELAKAHTNLFVCMHVLALRWSFVTPLLFFHHLFSLCLVLGFFFSGLWVPLIRSGT
ncbi:hypothetical protein K458DRAFT_145762 [Lentithecium fluviatile CBS 122367]|uniref:Uncharacterized protein n=1 Tax=Lentithecium fluviatile CBS 122367 TaxID=1168545 RepID=A0A6G1II52_9PLEO|nr:hypothetical protein K458DRAFT_145762 [Lentithecium fluviatile CBS 122367]